MTRTMDKNEALAICFRNLKGAKTKDLLLTARALKYLKGLSEFRSNKRLGEEVGVSGEIVRQFIALLDLPLSVQSYLEQGTLGLEQGRRLWQLNRTRPSLVEDAARAMGHMTAMETRNFVEYLVRTAPASVQDGLDALKAAKPIVSHEYHIDAILDEWAYRSLAAQAREQGVRVNELVSRVINRWLAGEHDVRLS